MEVRVPDLGGVDDVEVVEVLVSVGDTVALDDGLITMESEKASMDIPSTAAGTVAEVALEIGAKVKEGDLVVVLDVADDGEAAETVDEAPEKPAADRQQAEAPDAETPNAEAPNAEAPDAESEARASESPVADVKPRATTDDQRPEADRHTDLLVLGSGPGGYTAAFRAADLGLKVTLVEKHAALGGVCLNVGCIPSKALLHVGRVIEEAADLGAHGVEFGEPSVDLDKLRGFKDGVVSRLTKGLGGMADKREVEVVRGTGRFTSPHTLQVDTQDGETSIAFDQAVIAAGSRVVRIPGIPWDDPRVMTSTEALELADVPERLLLIGGGIIGLEMAMVYGSLGAALTIVEMLPGLVPGCDSDLVKPLERRLKRRFKAKIHLKTRVTEVQATEGGLEATFEGDKALEPQVFDRVLVAVGRRPNGDRIDAAAAGVAVDERGFITVDKQQRTNVSHIFAIGDIVGEPMLAHKATHEAKVAAEVAAGEKSAFDARVIPAVAYTDPEIAWVGLTETEAEATGTPYEKGVFPWSASGRSLGMGRSDGMTKILFDPSSHRILGGGIVGPSAGDLITELALAIEMGAEAGDLALTVHPHPTLSETVALAAEVYEGTVTDLYAPKKR